jgi:predicted nucleic acid-binding protein
VILVDAGPLVAWVDASDPHHARCVLALKGLEEPMATVLPAVAEALVALRDQPKGPGAVLEIIRRGAVRLAEVGAEDLPRIQELMSRYRDRGMDLTDAALVRVAERDGCVRVLTLDRGAFEAYRIGGRKRFRILPGAPAVRRKARRVPRARRNRRRRKQP